MKLLYHGEEIELDDTEIPGRKELDLITENEKMDDTQQYDFSNIINSNNEVEDEKMDDTQQYDFSNIINSNNEVENE